MTYWKNQFQSTLLQEERLYCDRIGCPGVSISIHAPTRGATQWLKIGVRERQNFNPRSYKRSDATRSNCNIFYLDFNPRSYKRSDDIIVFKFILSVISIHAPTRGATGSAICVFWSTVFQSTLLQEERPMYSIGTFSVPIISIHAPTRGATL